MGKTKKMADKELTVEMLRQARDIIQKRKRPTRDEIVRQAYERISMGAADGPVIDGVCVDLDKK